MEIKAFPNLYLIFCKIFETVGNERKFLSMVPSAYEADLFWPPLRRILLIHKLLDDACSEPGEGKAF